MILSMAHKKKRVGFFFFLVALAPRDQGGSYSPHPPRESMHGFFWLRKELLLVIVLFCMDILILVFELAIN